MKRYLSVLFALLMVAGLATAAGAVPTLSFRSISDRMGMFKTGTSYNILPGTSVMADIYFTVTEEGVIGGGLSMQYDSAQSAVLGEAFYSPFADTGSSYTTQGIWGYNSLFFLQDKYGSWASIACQIEFECLGIGESIILMIYDFGGTDDWVTILVLS